MFKRIVVALTVVCVVIGAIASRCLAYNIYGCDVKRVYNGSYWTEQAWIDFEADLYHDYYVKVYVVRNGIHYGMKRNTVLAGEGDRYYSYASQGTGGTANYYIQTIL